MVEFFVEEFPFVSEDAAIEAARYYFSAVSDIRIVRPSVRFLDESYPMQQFRNHWQVHFDVEREGELASTTVIRICIDASSGEVSQVRWDFSKRPIGVVRARSE